LVSPHPLYWVKDRDQILIVDEEDQEIYTLQNVEAALWVWLTLGYSYPKIVELSAKMVGLPSMEMEQRLRVIFLRWQVVGILAVPSE
jgi:hypothetical protein